MIKRKRQTQKNLQLDFKCQYCDKAYNTQSALYNHTQFKHEDKTTCQGCQKNYTNGNYLRMHQQKSEKCKPYLKEDFYVTETDQTFQQEMYVDEEQINDQNDTQELEQLRQMVQSFRPQFKSNIKLFLNCDKSVDSKKPSLFLNSKYPLFADTIFAFGSVDIDYNNFLYDLEQLTSKFQYHNQFKQAAQDLIYNQTQTKLELNQILIYKILNPTKYTEILKKLAQQKQNFFEQPIGKCVVQDQKFYEIQEKSVSKKQQLLKDQYIDNEIKYFKQRVQQENYSINYQQFNMIQILQELEIEENKPYRAIYEKMSAEEKKLIEPIIQYLFSFFDNQIKNLILKIILSAYIFPDSIEEWFKKIENNSQDYQPFNFLIKLKGKNSFLNFFQKISNLWQQ
ncbi:hypothetical protein ABPG72_003079 [Tetrahymena utriculariae]